MSATEIQSEEATINTDSRSNSEVFLSSSSFDKRSLDSNNQNKQEPKELPLKPVKQTKPILLLAKKTVRKQTVRFSKKKLVKSLVLPTATDTTVVTIWSLIQFIWINKESYLCIVKACHQIKMEIAREQTLAVAWPWKMTADYLEILIGRATSNTNIEENGLSITNLEDVLRKDEAFIQYMKSIVIKDDVVKKFVHCYERVSREECPLLQRTNVAASLYTSDLGKIEIVDVSESCSGKAISFTNSKKIKLEVVEISSESDTEDSIIVKTIGVTPEAAVDTQGLKLISKNSYGRSPGETTHSLIKSENSQIPADGPQDPTYVNNLLLPNQATERIQNVQVVKGEEDPIGLFQWLWCFLSSPANNIVYSSKWFFGPYKNLPLTSPILTTAFNRINFLIKRMTCKELFEHSRKISCNNILYGATDIDFSEMYYDSATSVEILDELLTFQYGNYNNVRTFLQSLFTIIDKKTAKMNTMYVIGPSYSGKSFFFDAVVNACINFGHMGNFNRYVHFPLVDCINRRIIMWEDPNAEPSAWKTLKTIFGGDSCSVKVNNIAYAVITRTPVIVLANRPELPDNEDFKSRLTKGEWRRADFLKKYDKKPHPLSIWLLFDKYGIFQ